MGILEDFNNSSPKNIGFLHIYAVVDMYGAQILMEPLRNISDTALLDYESAVVTDYIGFFNEIFKMFCLVCEDDRIERILECYHVNLSEYDDANTEAYEFPNIALNSLSKDADIFFIRDLYLAVKRDMQGAANGLTWYFMQTLQRCHGTGATPIGFIIDGNDNLCLKFNYQTPATLTTTSSFVTS